MLKRKYVYLYIVVIAIILIIFVYIVDFFKTKIHEEEFEISNYRIEEIIRQNIDRREILKLDKSILVGYSEKELENGYYDLKMYKEKQDLIICLNKAWKEFNNELYEEEYIYQIINSILSIFELSSSKAKNKIYDYIVEGYKISKGLINNGLNNNESFLDLGEIKLERRVENNELILSISKEVDK